MCTTQDHPPRSALLCGDALNESQIYGGVGYLISRGIAMALAAGRVATGIFCCNSETSCSSSVCIASFGTSRRFRSFLNSSLRPSPSQCVSSKSSPSSSDMEAVTTAATAGAMSSSCGSRSWAPSSRACLGGTSGKQHLSMKVVPRMGSGVGRSSTLAQGSSAVKRETENAPDYSLEAAVKAIEFTGVHHVGLLCENLDRSLDFYCGLLGLEINRNRPDDKLPYGGVWLNVGSPSQMIHLMELPNPDPKEGRPKHGGRDRHACVSVKDVSKIKEVFDKAGVPYTFSQSGRPALFARDPDGNALEFSQL